MEKMEQYGTFFWLIITIILAVLCVIAFASWISKHVEELGDKLISAIKEKINARQVKKILEEKKESILKPSTKGKNQTDEEHQALIEEVIQECDIANEQKEETEQEKKEDKKEEAEKQEEKADTKPTQDRQSTTLSKKAKLQLERIQLDAENLKHAGKFDEYEKKIIEGLAICSTHLGLTKMLAEYYFTTGSYKKAFSLLKKIIERDPQDHKSLRQIGEIYFVNEDLSTAELLITKAIKLKPDNPKYLLSMVEILYNTGRINDAITYMGKVIKLRPANTNYFLTLAELYEEIHDFANAKKWYFAILEIEPSHEKAKKKCKLLE